MPTLNLQCASGARDAQYLPPSTWQATLVRVNFGDSSGTDTYSYFQWPVAIPPNSTINTATLTLQAEGSRTYTSSDSSAMKMWVLEIFDSTSELSTDRSGVAVFSEQSITEIPSGTTWTIDTDYTIDVKTLLQAFVNHASYSNGDFFTIRLGNSNANNNARMTVKTYEHDALGVNSAKLDIDYTLGSPAKRLVEEETMVFFYGGST